MKAKVRHVEKLKLALPLVRKNSFCSFFDYFLSAIYRTSELKDVVNRMWIVLEILKVIEMDKKMIVDKQSYQQFSFSLLLRMYCRRGCMVSKAEKCFTEYVQHTLY